MDSINRALTMLVLLAFLALLVTGLFIYWREHRAGGLFPSEVDL